MSRAALLWDESYLWGVFACKSLRSLGLGFDLVRASEIRAGRLEGYGTLMVPGGWASNKITALGDEGAGAVRDFVNGGGNYLGICGGAGLATMDGLGLVDISRKPTRERVPSLSGPVRLSLEPHAIWEGTDEPVFNVWWPSQFVPGSGDIRVLARFRSATDEAMSSDLPVGDVLKNGGPGGWKALEEAYGLNLDPSRMSGEPLVIEASLGKGRVVLSLVHFDTPGDRRGSVVLDRLWQYLGAERSASTGEETGDDYDKCLNSRLFRAAAMPFELGLRNFLWYRRGPLVEWRRGVRGLEYFTLYTLADEICRREAVPGEDSERLAPEVEEFSMRAEELLMLERQALQRGEAITFRKASGERMAALREDLFSGSKSHGGRFKSIIEKLDSILYRLLVTE